MDSASLSTAYNGHNIVGHNGQIAGVWANVDIFTDLGYTAVVLINVEGSDPSVTQKMRDQVTQQ
jgi:hypothetical protein